VMPTMPTVTSPSTVSSPTTSTVGTTSGITPGSNPSGSTLAPTGPGS
jgi:hypothetical protein